MPGPGTPESVQRAEKPAAGEQVIVPGSDENAQSPLNPDAQPAADATDPAVPLSGEVPTMLDRLRGLYNPRVDENTDRVKKQIRRWPDPFGLFEERSSADPAVSAEVQPSTTEAVTDPESSSLPTDSEETPPAPNAVMPAVQAAITEVEKELASWPRLQTGKPDRLTEWRQRQTDLRLLYMIAGQSAESVRIIESLPEEEQEYWQSLMLSMNRYRETGENTTRTEQITESLDHLRTAAKKLQPLSQLAIRRAMLCDRIDGFGNVTAFPTSSFEPGQRILIYAEPQNLRSELTVDGKYRSEFAAVLEFMREGDDEIVETIHVPQMEDLCDVERTDYFQSFELTLPALEGKYLMRIRLRDQLSLQTAEANLEFTVRSRN